MFVPQHPLSSLSRFNVGGKAEYFLRPKNLEEIQKYIKQFYGKYLVIGNGSNILIRDGGIDGLVIKLGKEFSYIKKEDGTLSIGAATLNSFITQYSIANSVGGFEFLSGIPGNIGGAVAMNAGCYGSEIKDIISSFDILNKNGILKRIYKKDIKFTYRSANLADSDIVIAANFNINNINLSTNKLKEIKEKREKTQPYTEKTAGSCFKNPNGHKAWELIKNSGMDRIAIGGARFSPLHCNFLINYNNATATDLETLGEKAIESVYKKFGIILEWEVKRYGRKI